MVPKEKLLARDITKLILDFWLSYKEPADLNVLCISYSWRIKAQLGDEWSMLRFIEVLAGHGLYKILVARSGKHWIFLKDVWDGMSEAEQCIWLTRVNDWDDVIRSGKRPTKVA